MSRSNDTSRRVIIIGAGAGGLSAALSLSSAGFDVDVFEAGDAVGGKMARQDTSLGPIDTGPTVLTMRWVFDRLFEGTGRSFEDRVAPVPMQRLAHHRWSDGGRFDLWHDPARNREAVSEFSGATEVARFERFQDHAGALFEALNEPFIEHPQRGFSGLLGGLSAGRAATLLRARPFDSMWRQLGGFFDDSRLQQLYGRYATYCGSSPFRAPATMLLIAHVEQLGVWRVPGGMAALAGHLADAAREAGARIHCGRAVSEVMVRDRRAFGVRLADGTEVTADSIIFNGDPQQLAQGRLGNAVRDTVPRRSTRQRSLSAITLAGTARVTGDGLGHHNVFFSDDYRHEFAQLASGSVPDEPTVYLCLPDRPDGRGEGLERAFALINAPADADRETEPGRRHDNAIERVSARLAACGAAIEWGDDGPTVATPRDFARRHPGSDGAIYGMATHGWRAAFQRPGHGTNIDGFLLAGGGVHPGPGVPMAALSGINAARAVMEQAGAPSTAPGAPAREPAR